MTSPRILLINSDHVLRPEDQRLLVAAGFEQVIAVDVIDPDTVAEARDDWDVVLLDWRDNGPDFLAALRAHPATARACIVGITSYTDPMLVVAAKRGGINGWVVRPLAGASLADAINKAVARAAA